MDTRVAITAVLCMLVGAAAGWFLRPVEPPSEEPSVVDTPEPDPVEAQPPAPQPELGSDTTVLKAELDKTRKDLRDETARREGAEARIGELTAKVEELRNAAKKGTAPDAPVVAQGARYGYDRFKKTLEAIDWDVAGDAVAHIAPLLEELVKARAEGKPIPPSVGNIQRYNGSLVTAALTASQNGVPGTGVNGSFSHPAMLANMIYATLLKADQPLSESQEKKLKSLADDFVREDERRMAGYGESTLGLKKLLDETALKDRLFAAVDAMVTEKQRAVLHPEAVRGRTSADLFSSAVIWGTVIAPQRFQKPEDLAANLAAAIIARYQVPADQKAVVDELASDWVKSFPAGHLDEVADTLMLSGHYPVARVRIAAERQLVLFRNVLDRMPRDWAGADRFRQETFVALPIRTGP